MGAVRKLYARVVPDEVIHELRAAHPKVAARAIAAIQADVSGPGYALVSQRRADVELAVAAGLCAYCELLRGNARSEVGVDPLFRELGRLEALKQADEHALNAVLDAAASETWAEVKRIAEDLRVSARGVRDMVDLLFEQMRYLKSAAAQGRHLGAVERGHDRLQARRQLAAYLLGLEALDDPSRVAGLARWTFPDSLVVLVTRRYDGFEQGFADSDALVVVEPTGLAVALCEESAAERIGAQMVSGGHSLVARSPDGSPHDAAQMMRIAARALALAACGILPADDVVDCRQHQLLLWLSADPLVRRGIAERALAPLNGESPWRRQALERTLLAKLAGPPSAPAIAQELRMHPQSVRHRLKRISELFGDQLDDRERSLEALMVLYAQEKFSEA